LVTDTSTLEKRVQIIIAFRGYKVLEKEEKEENVQYIIETPRKEKIILWSLESKGAIGVHYIHQLKKLMDEKDIKKGMIISNGRYTQAAISLAKKNNIELIPLISPSFNIFQHVLVPKHVILTPEEREEVLKKYRIKPYQLPRIKASDPIAKAIGAMPGDIVKIIRKSPTAGEYIYYRYVVER